MMSLLTEITFKGLFLLTFWVSTGGFPHCQKPQMRYFHPATWSFLYRSREIEHWTALMSVFFFCNFMIVRDIYNHTLKHVDSRVQLLLCCVSFVSRRRDNLVALVNIDETRRRPVACSCWSQSHTHLWSGLLWCDWPVWGNQCSMLWYAKHALSIRISWREDPPCPPLNTPTCWMQRGHFCAGVQKWSCGDTSQSANDSGCFVESKLYKQCLW